MSERQAIDEQYMQLALQQAQLALQEGEVPIGAVIVRDGAVIASGYNKREFGKNALSHAEIEAIDSACRQLHGWRLTRSTLYVTLEPCPMCMGALINARIERIVFGAYDSKAGCCGSVLNMNDFPFNHHPEITTCVLEEKCAALLSSFFSQLRQKQKEKKRIEKT